MSHIVVVEDSPTQAAAIDMALVSAGHTVRHFLEASGLIDECLVSAPDLLIVDLNLGEGTGGLELCRQFKANLSLQTLPLLILTSSTVPGPFSDQGLRSGAGAGHSRQPGPYVTADQDDRG